MAFSDSIVCGLLRYACTLHHKRVRVKPMPADFSFLIFISDLADEHSRTHNLRSYKQPAEQNRRNSKYSDRES